ncbi:hypothetical protein [Sporomusa termitida]|nr:hypothetical protein [Sporomusa termitida]
MRNGNTTKIRGGAGCVTENWYAFALALMSPRFITIETAFEHLARGRYAGDRKFNVLSESDVQDMVNMRAGGETWKAVGMVYGLSMDVARRRILRFLESRERSMCDEMQTMQTAT